MKVLFFSHQADFVFGGEVVTLAFLRELRRQGIDCSFASPLGKYHQLAQEIVPTFEIPSIQFRRSFSTFVPFIFSYVKTFRALNALLLKNKIQVIQATSLKAMVYLLFISHDVKIIWHHHDIMPNRMGNRIWLRWLAKRADHILVPSRSAKSALELAGIGSNQITVVYNGFSLEEWPERAPEISPDQINIGFVGEISHRKGADFLPEILGFLLKNHPEISFVMRIAGEALSEKNLWHALLEQMRPFGNRVVFLGYLNDVKSFYQTIDILLVPSRQDPFPTVIIEAGLSGVPVIASVNGGIPEMIESGVNGFLANSPLEIAEKIALLALPGAWKKISKGAKKYANEKYDIRSRVKELSVVYQQLLRR